MMMVGIEGMDWNLMLRKWRRIWLGLRNLGLVINLLIILIKIVIKTKTVTETACVTTQTTTNKHQNKNIQSLKSQESAVIVVHQILIENQMFKNMI